MANEMNNQQDAPQGAHSWEKQVPSQLTTVTSLLAGFTFASLTVLITNAKPGILYQAVYIMAAVTVFNLVIVSIVGALLRVAYDMCKRSAALARIEVFWGLGSILGIVLFLATVALLSFLAGNFLGIVCSVLATLSATIIFSLWVRIGEAMQDAG